jgi:SAM-dependent methyltransferase
MLEFDRTISPNETMRAATEEAYFRVSVSAHEAIERAVFSAGKDPSSIKEILDFGCGHGRVLRALRAGYPAAAVTACDILEDGVNFCAETFGARPLLGHEDLNQISPPVKFDLIWVGSVFTHLPLERWRAFFDFFSAHLAVDGILVFTVHGRTAIWGLQHHSLAKSRLTKEQLDEETRAFKESGFAFVPYTERLIGFMSKAGVDLSPGLYGLSFTRPDWVCARLAEYPEFSLMSYIEGGWGRNHDTVAVSLPRVPKII